MSSTNNTAQMWQLLIELAKRGFDHTVDWTPFESFLHSAGLNTSNNPEAKFFNTLVAVSKAEQAAYDPSRKEITTDEETPAEGNAVAERKSSEVLIEAITYQEWELVEEVLRILKRVKKNVHPWALPAILDNCQARSDLHPLLKSVSGNRCSWVAAKQDRWTWWLRLDAMHWNEIPEVELINWIKLRRHQGDIELTAIEALGAKERNLLLQEIVQTPMPVDEGLGRAYQDSTLAPERGLAIAILWQLDTPEYKEMRGIVRSFCQKSIVIKKGQLSFRFNSVATKQFKYSDFPAPLFKDQPFLEILSLFGAQEIFGHLTMSPGDLSQALITNTKLQPLYRLFVHSATRSRCPENYKVELISAWIEHYPLHNSQSISIDKLLADLSYDSVQQIFRTLLADQSSYLIEKLLSVCAHLHQYIGQDISAKLVEKIFYLLTQSISRTEIVQLGEAIQHLQYLLDPRINQTIMSNWIEIDYRYKKLGEIMWEFRDTIKRRSILLASIIN